MRRSAPHFPTAVTQPGEQPHEAALRAIEAELGIPAALDRLIVGGPGMARRVNPNYNP